MIYLEYFLAGAMVSIIVPGIIVIWILAYKIIKEGGL